MLSKEEIKKHCEHIPLLFKEIKISDADKQKILDEIKYLHKYMGILTVPAMNYHFALISKMFFDAVGDIELLSVSEESIH